LTSERQARVEVGFVATSVLAAFLTNALARAGDLTFTNVTPSSTTANVVVVVVDSQVENAVDGTCVDVHWRRHHRPEKDSPESRLR